MTDIFHNPRKEIPKSDSRIERIDFDVSEMGARKSHIRGALPKNDSSIVHVSGGKK